MESKFILNAGTLVPIGLIGTILAAAVTFGVMYQKVDSLEQRVRELGSQNERIARLEIQLDNVTNTLEEIKADVKQLTARR